MQALFAAWAALVIIRICGPLADGARGAASLLGAGWAPPSAAILAQNASAHAAAVAVAAAMAAALWVTGLAVRPWARLGPALAVFAAFPLGYAAVSLLYLGLALAGLWFPRVLAAAIVAPAAAALILRRGRLLPRLGGPPHPGLPGWLVLAAVACILPWSLAPETQPDGWEYFLAGPERWLAAHRYGVLGATPPLHYPDIAEMLYAIPVGLGLDPAAKLLNAAAMLCGAGAVCSLLERDARGLGLLMFVTAMTPVFLMTTGKNEGFAAGFVLLAVAFAWRGAWTPAGLFAGLALSTKYLSVLNLAWLPLLMTAGRRRAQFLRLAGLAGAVTSPWLVKAWLLTGDPAYPVASGFLPWLVDGWDARNARVWHLSTAVDAPAGSWPVRAVQGLIWEHAGLALLLPALAFAGGRGRLVAAGSVAAYAAWQAGFPGPQTTRWAFPSIAAALILCGGPARRWLAGPRILRWALVAAWGLAAGHSLVRLAGGGVSPLPYAAGSETRAGFLARAFSTLIPAAEAIRAGGRGAVVLLVGEVREYGLPRPCLVANAHASGEAPLVWRLVNASGTDRDLVVRFRELGIRRLLYNYVTIKNVQFCHEPFRWDERMLRLYTAFCRLHLKATRVFDTADFANGGFVVYGFSPRPAARPPRTILYLPGAEAYCHTAVPFRNRGRMAEAVREHAALAAVCPEVLSFRAEWGHTLALSGDWPRAYALLASAVHDGFAEPVHLVNFGLAAVQLEKHAEADAVFRRCLTGAPSHAVAVRIGLGWAEFGLAVEAGKKRDLAGAAARLAEAEGFLEKPAGPPQDRFERERVKRLAYVYGLEADLARLRRDLPRASARYRAAAALVPGTPEAATWSGLADRLPGR